MKSLLAAVVALLFSAHAAHAADCCAEGSGCEQAGPCCDEAKAAPAAR